MAAARLLCRSSVFFQAQRSFSTGSALSAKGSQSEDAIQKLFLDKLKEYNVKSKSGQIPMTPEVEKQYKDETERLKRLYGADKEDLSKFPALQFDKQ